MPTRKIFYVPILKTKAGERWALSHLHAPTKAKLRPLLELHSHNTKTVGDHASGVCEALASEWGTDRWFYLDAFWLHGDTGLSSVLAAVFEAAEERDLKALPVVRTTFDDASIEQAQAIIEDNERGYMLRISTNDLNSPTLIDATVAAIAIPRNKIDLLLDYRHRAMDLAGDVQRTAP